jgi:hypothetical protein
MSAVRGVWCDPSVSLPASPVIFTYVLFGAVRDSVMDDLFVVVVFLKDTGCYMVLCNSVCVVFRLICICIFGLTLCCTGVTFLFLFLIFPLVSCFWW